jgi:hypothetical protein
MSPAPLRRRKCRETVGIFTPIMLVSSHTQRSPRDNSSTMNSRVGWAMVFITLACARNCFGVRLFITNNGSQFS